jgi:tetratricopeptide (TPR) repeat protein
MAPLLTAEEQQLIGQIARAMRDRDLKTASAFADRALAAGLRLPIIYNARALRFDELGRHEEALDALYKARVLAEPSPAIESAVGQNLLRLGRTDEAVASFAAAVELAPDSAILLCRLGFAQEAAGLLRDAERSYARALTIEPENPEAMGRLAFLCTRRGAYGEATPLAERCLALHPGQTAAMLALAACALAERRYDDAGLRLKALLESPKLGVTDRYLATTLQGDLFDARDDIAGAFERYTSAKGGYCEAFEPRFGAHSLKATVESMADRLNALPPQRPAREIDIDAPSPVFLLGFLRSGTTLLEQVLAGHGEVETLEEKDTLADSVRAFLVPPFDFERLVAATASELEEYRALYWKRVRGFGIEPDGHVFVDKRPINTVMLPVIATLFPRAKILYALRDPRDVVFSCFRRPFGINPTTYEFRSLENTARFYDAVMTLSEIARARFPLNVKEVRHEVLTLDFERGVTDICAFLGLSPDVAMKDFAKTAAERNISTPTAAQLSRGLNRDGVGQWRRYREQMASVLPLLERWALYFGYEPAAE